MDEHKDETPMGPDASEAPPGRPRVLDYALPDPPLRRRNSLEYYREPPEISTWGVGEWAVAVIGLFLLVWLALWLVGRWL